MKRSAFISIPMIWSLALGGGLGAFGAWWAFPAAFMPAPLFAPAAPASSSVSASSSASVPPLAAPGTPAPIGEGMDQSSSSTLIVAMSPTSGPVGTVVTVHGRGFTASSTVEFGGLAGARVAGVAVDGTQLTFVVPRDLGPVCQWGRACPEFLMLVRQGTYPVVVVTGGRRFDAGSFTVTGGGPLGTFPPATGTPVKPLAPAR